jgi:hypothetical protein
MGALAVSMSSRRLRTSQATAVIHRESLSQSIITVTLHFASKASRELLAGSVSEQVVQLYIAAALVFEDKHYGIWKKLIRVAHGQGPSVKHAARQASILLHYCNRLHKHLALAALPPFFLDTGICSEARRLNL